MKPIRTLLPILAVAAGGALIARRSGLFVRHPVGNPAVPEPARPVDLVRYSGRWYEIARYDQGFEKGCEGVTADYALKDDGRISVVNRCRKPNGRITRAVGTAKLAEEAGPAGAKLKVSFFGPFFGDYWVLDHDDAYRWSIVGEQSGRYLWILAREATPGAEAVDALIARAAALGYDTGMLVRTCQP